MGGADRSAPACSFAELYRDAYDRTVRLAWLLTRSAGDAEDLAQDAFVEVERRFDALDTPEAYLRSTLVNRCRRWQRRRAMGTERLLRLGSQRGGAPEAGDIEPADDALLRALAGLPYRQRAALVMRYWAGWSEAEIADALRCRPGTVKSLTSRALTRLKGDLAAAEPTSDDREEER